MSEVLYSVEHGVASITINRPEQRNALNPAVLRGIREGLRNAVETRAARVVTITGSGDKVFCAGADLKAALSNTEGQGFGRGDFRQLLLEIYRCPKPTVALARGHVMAGGMGIFLACDLGLACDDIHFSTPEIHVGLRFSTKARIPSLLSSVAITRARAASSRSNDSSRTRSSAFAIASFPRRRMATLFPEILATNSAAPSSNSFRGKTWLTIPSCIASGAGIRSPRNSISVAFFRPTWR